MLDPAIHNLPETASIFSISTIKLARDPGRVSPTLTETDSSLIDKSNLPPHHHNHQNQNPSQHSSTSNAGGFESNFQPKAHIPSPHAFIAGRENAYSVCPQRYVKSTKIHNNWNKSKSTFAIEEPERRISNKNHNKTPSKTHRLKAFSVSNLGQLLRNSLGFKSSSSSDETFDGDYGTETDSDCTTNVVIHSDIPLKSLESNLDSSLEDISEISNYERPITNHYSPQKPSRTISKNDKSKSMKFLRNFTKSRSVSNLQYRNNYSSSSYLAQPESDFSSESSQSGSSNIVSAVSMSHLSNSNIDKNNAKHDCSTTQQNGRTIQKGHSQLSFSYLSSL